MTDLILEPVAKLAKDLRLAAATLSKTEARFLVDAYYAMQKDRIRDDHQERQLLKVNEPASVLSYLGEQHEMLEKQIGKALDVYSDGKPIGRWMRSIVGIGPVIAAGMLAHIDIERAETASDIWRFAGLDPSVKWEKKTKRPWNANLKRLCWILGESFVKTSGHERSFYGPIYAKRKEFEMARNESGGNAETAAKAMAEKKFGQDTSARKALLQGKLPQAQIHARAQRYAVKMFLSHLHEKWRTLEGLPVRDPYPVAVGKITGEPHEKIEPPN